MLALVLLKLIPVSIAAIGESAALMVVVGFAVIHFFEHTVVAHLHFGEETHADAMVSKAATLAAFTGLFIHSFFDGFSISAGIQFNYSIGILVFLAVLLHKFPEGLTIGSIMLAAGYSKNVVLYSVIGIGLATILGVIAVTLLATIDETMVGMAFAFSAGVALYVGASDLIPEINKSKDRIPPLVVFAGMLFFYVTDLLVERLLMR
jgi:zinc transporter ZupT